MEEVEAACVVLSPDAQTARLYAMMREVLCSGGVSIPYHDIWIAVLAEHRRLLVVSRDTHFYHLPAVQRVTW